MISGTLSSWHANAAMALSSPGFGRAMRAVPFGLLLGALMLVDDQHPLLALACAIASAILFDVISLRAGVPAFIRRNMMATVHERSTPITYTWDDEYLSWVTQVGAGRRLWAEYVGLAESEDVLLLFIEPDVYQIFPKPWFRGEAQLEEFKSLASAVPSAIDLQWEHRDSLREWLPMVLIFGASALLVLLIVVGHMR
jgi:hypothetical protein